MLTSELHFAVQKILLEDWDPIGIVALGGPPDEYDRYALALVGLLLGGAGVTALADYLSETRSLRMCIGNLKPTDVDYAVAEALVKRFQTKKTQ